MLYWLTRTGGSAARFHYEDAHATHPTEPTTVPIGLAPYEGDFSGIRRFAERAHRAFFRSLRSDLESERAVPRCRTEDLT